jgi:putative Mg2+ transporter-C (MgtC) family protein
MKSMIADLDHIALNLSVALCLGATIGVERQWRQRLAGLRTNTLVSLGAASFVVFASLFPGEASPTRVAAQVVSGIGFLGAGIIFREGLNVRGLNTAATLWCSAAVGLLAGSGAHLGATLVAAMIVAVNLLLRPLVRFINRQPHASTELGTRYEISVVCRGNSEAQTRALLLQGLSASGLHLHGLESSNIESTDHVRVVAHITTEGRSDAQLEQIVGRLSLEPTISAACWILEDRREEDTERG